MKEKQNIEHNTFVNQELKLAGEFVQQTGSNIFLTGKAGTGKTTFLHSLKGNISKRMIVTAPTGVAAINAGGVTLHSFFQLPFGPFVPGSDAYERSRQHQFRFSKEKKQIIKTLDLLVIDEISMVRADLLDAVDSVLKIHRNSRQPFGGVQVLMIGDLYQLSPVAQKHEWDILKEYYESVYFFSSKVLLDTDLVTIELKHIYRQSDREFIRLLNSVRDNRLDQEILDSLNEHYVEDFVPDPDEGYITLTTHNKNAQSINHVKLEMLQEKAHHFKAGVSGGFPEHTFPTLEDLFLKKGAQVMFVRNDTSNEKRYYNGKIGMVSSISDNSIGVTCPGEEKEIIVDPVVWQNIKYTVNKHTREIEEEVIGEFIQYPLKLAWAITIHKGQGLTFEKAIIDANQAFTHGQVYVALSRCKTLEGMVLSSPVSQAAIGIDRSVKSFTKTFQNNPPSLEKLDREKVYFQQQLLLECFDFTLLKKHLNWFERLVLGNRNSLHVTGIENMPAIKEKAEQDIFNVSEKFLRQLQTIFNADILPEADAHVLERVSRASAWFEGKLVSVFGDVLEKTAMETDNTKLRSKVNNALNNLKQEKCVKLAGIQSLKTGFSPSNYLESIAKAVIDFTPSKAKKPKPVEYAESDIKHPELFETLKAWRSKVAKKQNVPNFMVMHQKTLIQIVVTMPCDPEALQKTPGIGKVTIEKYGDDLIRMVEAYQEARAT